MAKHYTPFQFRNFAVAHQQSAHKIGTDSILLASWLQADAPKRILDFGSGCGIISFLAAERFPDAQVIGIEKDRASYLESLENRNRNPHAERLDFQNLDIEQFRPAEKFDLIVSNPPYFTDGIKAPDENRAQARHSDPTIFWAWMRHLSSLLKADGTLALILPPDLWNKGQGNFNNIGLHAGRVCSVQHHSESPVKRVLVELSPTNTSSGIKEELILYRSAQSLERSPAFQALIDQLMPLGK